MTAPSKPAPETIEIEIPGTSQTIIDTLRDQYRTLDAGEVRARLEDLEPEVWSKAEFEQLFDTTSENPPYVDVVRRSDGVRGTVMFIDSPRFYFTFHAGNTSDERSAT